MSALKVAETVGADWQSVMDAEYQPGQWTLRLYVIDGDYYTVTRGERPPRVLDRHTGRNWSGAWERVKDNHLSAQRAGVVWVSHMETR